MRVELTDIEMRLAIEVAVERFRKNRSSGVLNGRRGPQDDFTTDLEGFAAELVVAKAVNVFPDTSTCIRQGGFDIITPKGSRIDVKATRYESGKLLVLRSKKMQSDSADIYVLVIGTFPSYRIAGYARREDVFKEANIDGHNFALTQDQLEPWPQRLTLQAA